MKNELWKAIPGYEGVYEASSFGRIRSLDRVVKQNSNGVMCSHPYPGRLLTPTPDDTGRLRIKLRMNGSAKDARVSSLIALAFIGPRPKGLLVLHGNGDDSDNHIGNLRYGTQKENMADSLRHGTIMRGERHVFAKLTEAQVLEIRSSTEKLKPLAERYGVCLMTISDIRNRKRWGHL